MHTKLHHSDDFEEILKQVGQAVQLVGTSGHIKAASTPTFSREKMASHLKDKHSFLFHAIAMGNEERYGFSKNRDSWPDEDLHRKHATFVSHGHFYREHRNKGPHISIGDIVESAYDKNMGRVELLIRGRLTKSAASNLTAEEEYEKLKRGEDLDVSMSAKVPFDVCSCCSKKASSPKQYCVHAAKHLGRWLPEFQKFAYVSNPNPTFVDISSVKNRADRIAKHISALLPDQLDGLKAASAEDFVISGSRWAELEGLDYGSRTSPFTQVSRVSEARRLAQAEEDARGFDKSASAIFGNGMACGELSDSALAASGRLDPSVYLRKLARVGAIMPLATFNAWLHGAKIADSEKDPVVSRAYSLSEGLMRKIAEEGCEVCDTVVAESVFEPAGSVLAERTTSGVDGIDALVEEAERKFGLGSEVAAPRAAEACAVPGMQTKAASTIILPPDLENRAVSLAEAYALYKVAAVTAIRTLGRPGLVDNVFTLAAATLR